MRDGTPLHRLREQERKQATVRGIDPLQIRPVLPAPEPPMEPEPDPPEEPA